MNQGFDDIQPSVHLRLRSAKNGVTLNKIAHGVAVEARQGIENGIMRHQVKYHDSYIPKSNDINVTRKANGIEDVYHCVLCDRDFMMIKYHDPLIPIGDQKWQVFEITENESNK